MVDDIIDDANLPSGAYTVGTYPHSEMLALGAMPIQRNPLLIPALVKSLTIFIRAFCGTVSCVFHNTRTAFDFLD